MLKDEDETIIFVGLWLKYDDDEPRWRNLSSSIFPVVNLVVGDENQNDGDSDGTFIMRVGLPTIIMLSIYGKTCLNFYL